MENLFHVSEQSGIEKFEPRMPPTPNSQVMSPVVWAVDDSHVANYLLPRDCPRVTFQVSARTSARDCDRFFGAGAARHVVVIESRWLERATSGALWIYEFSPEPFRCIDSNAGYFVSSTPVTPVSQRRIEAPLVELAGTGAELRVLTDLSALAADVAASTLAFSCIRMRNALAGPGLP